MVYNGRNTVDLEALTKEHFRYDYDDTEVRVRARLDASLNSFLHLAYDPDLPFFYWLSGLNMRLVDETFPFEDNELEDLERFVIIYDTTPDAYSHTMGVVYDQQRHLAAVPLTIEDTESIEPIDEHEEMWYPLETILTHWIYLIRIGKVVIDPTETWSNPARSQIGLWGWLPYCQAQIESTIAAMDRYVTIIESRMPPNSHLAVSGPLFTDAELDAAAVPQECFVRSFLTRVKTPRFKFIGPGLEVLHDKAAFAARQKFTVGHLYDRSGNEFAPAVLLFAAADSDTTAVVKFNNEIRWLFLHQVNNVTMDEYDLIPAGLYSEATDRGFLSTEEAGFRLLLPFVLRPNYSEDGARMSDRGLVKRGSYADLFQRGQYRPFGGECGAQRLEKLFERWAELIETGVWTVGKDGVEGSIDKFRDASRGDGWMNYWITPSW